MTPNDQLAKRAIAIADDHMAERKAALCAAVALSTTSSIRAAKRALEEWPGPESIKRDGLALIDTLTTKEWTP